nr:AlpA family phage regulatory protein [uncultured Rhodoferax sp.]
MNTNDNIDTTIPKRFLNKKTLHSMVPLCERSIDSLEKKGLFPKRFTLTSRRVVWDFDDITTWMKNHKEACKQAARPGIPTAS